MICRGGIHSSRVPCLQRLFNKRGAVGAGHARPPPARCCPYAIPPNNPVKLCHPYPLTPPFYTCRIKLSSTTVEQRRSTPCSPHFLLRCSCRAFCWAWPRWHCWPRRPGCKNATARSGSAACGSRWRCCFWCRCTRLCPRPRRRCPWIPHRCTAGPPFRRKSPSAPPTVCPTWLPWRATRPRATSCPAPSCRRDTARCWNASLSAQRG